ncbi:hypothetical protein SFR_5595 [Streptomyces sp. FR-008]|nr:hypothetical protein SFR_5595 [Streptomyces sp. FR-008]
MTGRSPGRGRPHGGDQGVTAWLRSVPESSAGPRGS